MFTPPANYNMSANNYAGAKFHLKTFLRKYLPEKLRNKLTVKQFHISNTERFIKIVI
jgi:hypothetical protein